MSLSYLKVKQYLYRLVATSCENGPYQQHDRFPLAHASLGLPTSRHAVPDVLGRCSWLVFSKNYPYLLLSLLVLPGLAPNHGTWFVAL